MHIDLHLGVGLKLFIFCDGLKVLTSYLTM